MKTKVLFAKETLASSQPRRVRVLNVMGVVAVLALGALGAAIASAAPVAGSPLSEKLAAFSAAVKAQGRPFTNLDAPSAQAKLSPRLMLPELSSTFDGPAGPVAHLPAHVSTREGGRVSLFELMPGATSTVGVYVFEGRVYDRRVTRLDGAGQLAKGDRLEEQLVDANGQVAQTFVYQVTAVDYVSGSAQFSNIKDGGFENGDIVNGQKGWCWSCAGGSSWWCGFPCFPRGPSGPSDIPTTAALCGA